MGKFPIGFLRVFRFPGYADTYFNEVVFFQNGVLGEIRRLIIVVVIVVESNQETRRVVLTYITTRAGV